VSFVGLKGRLNDVEALTVNEEGMVAESPIELWHRRMIVGDRLCLELAQSALYERRR
jgi:hypothetical protein